MMELEMFPEELRKQAVEIGHVLKMDMYPSKEEDKLIAALLINSHINPNLFNRIGPYQHEISKDRYDFLDHTSYIDGYSIREFDVQRVLYYAKYLGSIEPDDLQEAINHVCDSPDVKPYILKKYHLKKR